MWLLIISLCLVWRVITFHGLALMVLPLQPADYRLGDIRQMITDFFNVID